MYEWFIFSSSPRVWRAEKKKEKKEEKIELDEVDILHKTSSYQENIKE